MPSVLPKYTMPVLLITGHDSTRPSVGHDQRLTTERDDGPLNGDLLTHARAHTHKQQQRQHSRREQQPWEQPRGQRGSAATGHTRRPTQVGQRDKQGAPDKGKEWQRFEVHGRAAHVLASMLSIASLLAPDGQHSRCQNGGNRHRKSKNCSGHAPNLQRHRIPIPIPWSAAHELCLPSLVLVVFAAVMNQIVTAAPLPTWACAADPLAVACCVASFGRENVSSAHSLPPGLPGPRGACQARRCMPGPRGRCSTWRFPSRAVRVLTDQGPRSHLSRLLDLEKLVGHIPVACSLLFCFRAGRVPHLSAGLSSSQHQDGHLRAADAAPAGIHIHSRTRRHFLVVFRATGGCLCIGCSPFPFLWRGLLLFQALLVALHVVFAVPVACICSVPAIAVCSPVVTRADELPPISLLNSLRVPDRWLLPRLCLSLHLVLYLCPRRVQAARREAEAVLVCHRWWCSCASAIVIGFASPCLSVRTAVLVVDRRGSLCGGRASLK